MDQLFLEIAKLAPQVGILAYFVHYFQKEIKTKDEEIRKLNDQLRADQKETVQTMMKLTQVIDDLRELIKEVVNKSDKTGK